MARGIFGVELSIIFEIFVTIIAGVVLLMILSTAWNPHAQVSAANVQALALAIDDACARAVNAEPIEMSFNMPQPVPPVILGGTIFPQFSMRINGDPHYLVYYENFPPGEAITWEIYNDYPSRAVVFADPHPDETLGEYISRFRRQLADAGFSTDLSRYAFGNFILRDRQPEGEINLAGDIGEWNGNTYKFDTKSVLPKLEESLAKYRGCGAYSLCFKTRDGIFSIPLENCEKANISMMQVVRNDVPNHPEDLEEYAKFAGVGAAAGGVVGFFFVGVGFVPGTLIGAGAGTVIGIFVNAYNAKSASQQISDFYLASPCKTKIEIKKTECICQYRSDYIFNFLENKIRNDYASKPFSLYSTSDGTLEKTKEKQICTHFYTDGASDLTKNRDLPDADSCIQIVLGEMEDTFCTGGQNELGQVTLGARWIEKLSPDEDFEAGAADLRETKPLREAVTIGGDAGLVQKIAGKLRIPWGWPKG